MLRPSLPLKSSLSPLSSIIKSFDQLTLLQDLLLINLAVPKFPVDWRACCSNCINCVFDSSCLSLSKLLDKLTESKLLDLLTGCFSNCIDCVKDFLECIVSPPSVTTLLSCL